MNARKLLYGSCAARDGHGVLVLGESGTGKSELVLRLLGRGFMLVADDQVEVEAGLARAPASLAGLLEVRGLGIVRLPYVPEARLALVVQLGEDAVRLPQPEQHPELDLPMIRLAGTSVAAAERIALALDCVVGKVAQVAGAFAA